MMALSSGDAAVIATALLAGSELLSLIPAVRANGWLQLVFQILRALAGRGR
jgi:hypothetical protein